MFHSAHIDKIKYFCGILVLEMSQRNVCASEIQNLYSINKGQSWRLQNIYLNRADCDNSHHNTGEALIFGQRCGFSRVPFPSLVAMVDI